jgi:hypothetical protein
MFFDDGCSIVNAGHVDRDLSYSTQIFLLQIILFICPYESHVLNLIHTYILATMIYFHN